MRPSKPHGFIAWLFDCYSLSILLATLAALLLSLLGRPGDLTLGLSLFGVSLLVSTAYHRLFASRTFRLSPGEMIGGRFVRDDTKVWLNPYSKTRWPAFAVLLATVIIAGNTWDSIFDGATVALGLVLGRAVVVLAIVYCLVLVGRGRPGAFFPISIYWFVMAVGSLGLATDAAEALSLGLVFGAPAVVALVLGIVYPKWLLASADSTAP